MFNQSGLFNTDTQFQRIQNGQQTYAEIKDSQDNTLLVVSPGEDGHYNVYNSYGEYVDAAISDHINDTINEFKDGYLKGSNVLNSTGSSELGFDLEGGNIVASGETKAMLEQFVNAATPDETKTLMEKMKTFVATVGNLMPAPTSSLLKKPLF